MALGINSSCKLLVCTAATKMLPEEQRCRELVLKEKTEFILLSLARQALFFFPEFLGQIKE